MSLKVANIVLEGRFGGPQNRILQVAERLKGYGIETIVVMPKKESDFFQSKLVMKNVAVRRLSLHRLQRNRWDLLVTMGFFIPELIALVRCLKQENVDLVHCNGVWQIKGVLAGKLAGCKVILHLNDAWAPWWMGMLFTVVGRLCDAFIVTGLRVRRSYFVGFNKRLEKKNIAEIQAPVDTSIFNPDRVKPDSRLANVKKIKITTVGNINPLKGFEFFVKMAYLLNKRHDQLIFYIVGAELASRKEYYKKLLLMKEELNIKNIVFLGQTDDVPSVLKASDIFVCTSVTESGPMSVWEAMAMEKAIVSTDVGDVGLYIRNNENGFVVPIRNSEMLAEKVSLLIENEKLRAKLGKSARQTAIQELDISICSEKHSTLYLNVLADSM